MSDARPLRHWMQLSTGVAVVSLLLVTTSSASTTWSWHASGTLGARQNCSKVGVRLSKLVCGFHVANAPRSSVRETVRVRFTNTTARTTCFGLSISTSYMGGLQSVCVKAKASGAIAMGGPGRHFRDTQLSVFVTSASTTRPIAPMRDRATYHFTVLLRQMPSQMASSLN
ncbi:MAG: hypothetical protein ACYC1I_00615 [Acidimicrobiales bacterium]